MKKWNWSLFWFILIIAFIGALGNKSAITIAQASVLALAFGIPFGLFWAWVTKVD